MIVELKYYAIPTSIGPGISKYPKEYMGVAYGSISGQNHNLVISVDYIIPDMRAEGSVDDVYFSDARICNKVSRNLDSLLILTKIALGDFHTHTGWDGYKKEFNGPKNYLKTFKYSTDLSEDDLKTMNKDPGTIELVLALDNINHTIPRIGRPQRAPDGKSIMGSTKEYNFMYSVFHWNKEKDRAQKTKIICTYLTGIRYN